MESILWLNKEQVTEFCREHANSVFREASARITPILAQLGSDWSGWEKAEAAIGEAIASGDFRETVKRCDSYLNRVTATVEKWTAREAA